MSSVNCSYPGCPRTVSGKGLFCATHFPEPGEINKYLVNEELLERGAYPQGSSGAFDSRSSLGVGLVAVALLLGLIGILVWAIKRFFF